jgi:HlyD family secretion protein
MNWTQKRVLTTIAAAVGALALLALATREHSPTVLVAPVRRENLDSSISSNGKVEPLQPVIFRAAFPSLVERLLVAEGQPVKRQQLLLTLEAAEARARLAQAREALAASEVQLQAARAGGPVNEQEQVRSELRKSEAEVARLRQQRDALERLLAQQASTPDELAQNHLALERAESDLRFWQQKKEERTSNFQLDVGRAQQSVERARNDVLAWEKKVGSTEVKAPADGVLYSLPVRAGDFVQQGDLLAAVADLHRVGVLAFVDEPDLGLLEKGQRIDITWDGAPGRTWVGNIEEVPKQVVARGTRSVGQVQCSVPNEDQRLLPNINVGIRIHVRQQQGVLLVPRGAVHVEGGQHYVFLLVGSQLRRREIHVGAADAGRYEVLSGLAEGDRVALPGDLTLRDGLRVDSQEQP